MAFKTIDNGSGKAVILQTASSTTIAKWDALDFSSWYVQRATSSSTDVHYIAEEAVVTAAGEHEDIKCTRVDWVKLEGDTAWNTSQALVWTYIDLTDHDTLNQAASTTNVFYVEKLVGAAADKKVQGYFVRNVS